MAFAEPNSPVSSPTSDSTLSFHSRFHSTYPEAERTETAEAAGYAFRHAKQSSERHDEILCDYMGLLRLAMRKGHEISDPAIDYAHEGRKRKYLYLNGSGPGVWTKSLD